MSNTQPTPEPKKKSPVWIFIGIGAFLVLCCCIIIGALVYMDSLPPTIDYDDTPINWGDTEVSGGVEDPTECNSANSEYFSFHGVEETIVSKNPCEVMWLLAKSDHEYTQTAKSGQTIYVTVWKDFENNVKEGNTFTIRALDVPDADESREDANISITRWVGAGTDLEQAKTEVNNAIANLEF